MREDLPVRPQPLGTFSLPGGYLLVPPADGEVDPGLDGDMDQGGDRASGVGTDAAREQLVAGRLPREWPASMRAHRLALQGDRDAALAELARVIDGAAASDRASGPVRDGDGAPGRPLQIVARYNRFVLDPDAEDPDQLRAGLGEYGILVDLVRFVLGRSDTPPEVGDATGELAALALSAQASHALAGGDVAAAVTLLDAATELAAPLSPPLAGMLLGAAAAACRDSDPDGALVRLTRAVRLLDGADDLRVARAEIHLALAGLLHAAGEDRPDQLVLAIPHYHTTLQLVMRDDAPDVWASAHADLATAYLTMPMVQASDQLRLGVAAQSLRSALTVWTRDTHPEQWARTQLNLANSLVYTPSKHQADNLVEAVELYEAVLEVRDRETDPLGRARVLANQGNVLAHLGSFDDAKARLYEARFLFEEAEDEESVRAVRGVLDEVARQRTLLRTGGA